MLTPLFSLSQTNDELIMDLRIPLADLSLSEFLIEDDTLYFTAPPYYLKMKLPGSVYDDADHIKFEIDSGNMKVKMGKTNPGEHFSDLDLISRFMVTSTANKTQKVGIQVMDAFEEALEGATEYNWFAEPIEHSVSEGCEVAIGIGVIKYPYGFAASKLGLFEKNSEAQLVLDLKNADFVPPHIRHTLQREELQEKFYKGHYMADYFEKEAIAPAMNQSIPWIANQQGRPEFTDDHRHRLTVLATHPLPLLPPIQSSDTEIVEPQHSRVSIYLGLVDLLLAYTYDYRVTMGEHNCESGWTIAKVAGTLSWLEIYPNLPRVVLTFYERALTYPLIRNFKLCRKVSLDVSALLQHENAKGWILFALLEIRRMLIEYPGYYFYAELYLDDYIVWLQKSASTYVLKQLGKTLSTIKLKKEDVCLPLKEAEEEGMEILADEVEDVKLNE
nr:protein shq1 [Hymenolepis microstoma]